jgi:hypothetical protein
MVIIDPTRAWGIAVYMSQQPGVIKKEDLVQGVGHTSELEQPTKEIKNKGFHRKDTALAPCSSSQH